MPSVTTMLWQGILYPRNFLKGRMQNSSTTVETLAPDSGAIVEENGKKVAVYKGSSGEVTKVSAVCTHMACIVGWNGVEKTWDCPCHGSRFAKDGKVIHGPATKDLPTVA